MWKQITFCLFCLLVIIPAIAHAVDDEALVQRVTYKAKRKTVSAILNDLSAMTGVAFKAGMTNDDWQVRDRKMNIFVKDMPLSNLMNSIANVMKFKWSRRDQDGEVYYRLYMDRELLLGVERQRLIIENRLRKRALEGRRNFLDGIDKVSGLSEDELEELKTESPYMYMLAKHGDIGVFSTLFSECSEAREAWLTGRQFSVDNSTVSQEFKQKLGCMMHQDNVISANIILAGVPATWNGTVNVAQLGSITVSIVSKDKNVLFGAIYMDPESEHAKLTAESLETTDPSQLEEIRGRLDELGSSELVDLGEPVIDHEDDSSLSKKIKFQSSGNKYADLFEALADEAHLEVVSDSLDISNSALTFSSDETELQTVLNMLESDCRYNWDKNDSTVEFRDRDWFRKRSLQIPELWLEKWRKAYRDNGLLDLKELSEIVLLKPDQYSFNIEVDDVLANVDLRMTLWLNRKLLYLYATLSIDQQLSVFSESGLDLNGRTKNNLVAAEVLLTDLVDQQNSSLVIGQPTDLPKDQIVNGLRLVGKHEKNGKSVRYTFDVMNSSGEPAGKQWTFTCPVYSPPSEETKKVKTSL